MPGTVLLSDTMSISAQEGHAPHADLEQLDKLEKWLRSTPSVGKTLLMPLDHKVPLFRHSGQHMWDWSKVEKYREKQPRHISWGLLLDRLCAVDADSQESWHRLEAESSTDAAEALSTCPVQETRKGRHYLFLRPAWADEEGYYDGARQSAAKDSGLDVDFKSLCGTGTRGVLVVAPSIHKSWLQGRAPWDDDVRLQEIPRELLERVATATHKAQDKKGQPKAQNKKGNSRASGGESSSPAATSSGPLDDVQQLLQLLDMSRWNDRTEWRNIATLLKNHAGDQYKEDWVRLSRTSPKFNEKEAEKLWSTVAKADFSGRPLTLATLHDMAKHDAAEEYARLMSVPVSHPEPSCPVISQALACNGTHNAVASIAAKVLGSNLVCATSNGSTWYRFDATGTTRWLQIKGVLWLRHQLSTTVANVFRQAVQHLSETLSLDDLTSASVSSGVVTTKRRENRAMARHHDQCSALDKIALSLEDKTFKDKVVTEMCEFLYDEDFLTQLDANPNLLGFDNGVWVLDQGCYRRGLPEDRVSLSVGCDYRHDVDQEAAAYVARYWAMVHPDQEQCDYVKRMFSRQLYGDSGGNYLHIHAGFSGRAGNGKSLLFEVLNVCAVGYVHKFGIEVLTASKRPEAGKPMPEVDRWRGRRILYCVEPNATDVINVGIMKDLTGGDRVVYRLLYSNEVQEFSPQYKLHILCNNTPSMDTSDEGVRRRLRKIDYVSTFVADPGEVDKESHRYLRDTGLLVRFRTDAVLRMEFMRSLLVCYKHGDEVEMPPIVQGSSAEYMDAYNVIGQFIADHVVLDEGAFFTLKEAGEVFKRFSPSGPKVDQTKLKDSLRNALAARNVRFQEQKKVPGGRKNLKNVFLGARLEERAASYDYGDLVDLDRIG